MKTLEEIQKHLDETVNTLLGQHRGRVDLVSFGDISGEGNAITAFVKMSGGCRGCTGVLTSKPTNKRGDGREGSMGKTLKNFTKEEFDALYILRNVGR